MPTCRETSRLDRVRVRTSTVDGEDKGRVRAARCTGTRVDGAVDRQCGERHTARGCPGIAQTDRHRVCGADVLRRVRVVVQADPVADEDACQCRRERIAGVVGCHHSECPGADRRRGGDGVGAGCRSRGSARPFCCAFEEPTRGEPGATEVAARERYTVDAASEWGSARVRRRSRRRPVDAGGSRR